MCIRSFLRRYHEGIAGRTDCPAGFLSKTSERIFRPLCENIECVVLQSFGLLIVPY